MNRSPFSCTFIVSNTLYLW